MSQGMEEKLNYLLYFNGYVEDINGGKILVYKK